jgi:hypothetical protein
MSFLHQFCLLLYDSHVGTTIRESTNLFPVIETVHVLGITLLVGTVAVMDLRLLGVVLKHEKFSNIASSILPLVWTGFTIMFVSGFLLFWSEAAKSYGNVAFRIKLVLLLLAGLNPLIFHSTIYRTVDSWDDAPVAPVPARISAFCSLGLWAAIIVAGRAIAYGH